jgi:hypothetical protein
MAIKSIALSLFVALTLVDAVACKKDPERPESQRTTGDELEHESEEAAEDAEEAIDEATEDLDDDK